VSAAFRRVAVLGLGLLGGSVALAARRRRVGACVVGAARRADVLEQALRMGAVDEAADFRAAARGADLLVLATPVYAMPELVREVAPVLSEGALLTDVGSVKSVLADTLPGLLPAGVAYVGAHPMAGSHRRGIEHARADLFEGAICVVMQTAEPGPRERVAAFWRALGARVVLRDPAHHDADVAWVSHLPHALAFAFARAAAHAPEGAFEVRGPGFRDFTRIAHSDPELWADILIGNRKALAPPLQAVSRELDALVGALEAEDAEALERLLGEGRAALALGEAAATRRSGRGEEPEPPAAERPDGARESRRRHS
jgi:prephenate dehydrogenase